MTKYICFLIANIILLVTGQIVWKIGVGKLQAFTIPNLLSSSYIWCGVILYGIATFLWLKVLSLAPLSVAYPMQSIAYVLGIVIAGVLFHEAIPLTRWIGGAVIIFGVYLVSL